MKASTEYKKASRLSEKASRGTINACKAVKKGSRVYKMVTKDLKSQ